MKLGEIAEIQSGLVLSRKRAETEFETVKSYKIITLKSLVDGILNLDYIEDFSSVEELSDKYITQKGDVLIRLSEPNTAIYINEILTGYLVPSNFSIIRLKTDNISPEFLALYLNSRRVKREMKISHIGSTIRAIKKSFLSNLEIEEIPLEKQKIVTEIRRLHLKEKSLLKELLEQKEKLYQGVINKVL
ncbi:restriction endonuclease subunit S [Natroniella sp. ANB-PHB2]|uniref:restriction endonuclease subunit S n=1 Tax=Natroniella sp. ANB-PHB2 TaxID=3384444 RepID=UPI0038D5094F